MVVSMVRESSNANAENERAVFGEVGDEIVSADPNEDEDDDDADEPTTESERLRRAAGRDPTRLRLQFLNQLRGVRMPRMNVVQMADQVLGPHRHVANRTSIHIRHW